MKLDYFPDTDSLYIDFRQQPSVGSIEVADGIVLDFYASGELVGIDIGNASSTVDLDHLILTRMHAQIERIAG